MMKVAVTGASGHIGLNLIPELISKGYEVRLLAHENTNNLHNFDADLVQGDLMDKDSLVDFVNSSDIVIHLAALITISKRSPKALKVNIEGTRNILEASRDLGVKRFIHLSSIHSVNAFPESEIIDESRELVINSPFDYDRSKAMSEQMVIDFADDKFSTTVLNPTAVLGPKDYQPSFLGEAIIRFYKGKIPAIMNGGYNWVDVRDVVRAILSVIEKAPDDKKFMIAGHWKSLKELVHAIEKSGGASCPRLVVPFWLARLGAFFLNSLTSEKKGRPLFTTASLETLQHSHKTISIEKAQKVLNYQPRPFEESIQDTLEWYKENKMLD